MAGTSIERTGDQAPSHSELEVPTAHGGHLVHYNPDAPSEEWGWHGSWRDFAPRGTRILLWVGVAIMFIMLIGNHVSHVEDYYLIATGLLLAVWLLRGEAQQRRERRRKV